MYRWKVKEIYMQEEEGGHPIIFSFLFSVWRFVAPQEGVRGKGNNNNN